MRVCFLQDYSGREFTEHHSGDIVDIDRGVAERFIARGIVEARPRTEDEMLAAASAPQPGDETREPKEIARRTKELLALMRSQN